MEWKNIVHFSRFAILPALFVIDWAIEVMANGHAINRWLPEWDTLSFIASLIILERLYVYKRAVSQRHLLARDISSTLVNVYFTGAATGAIVLPVMMLLQSHTLGRKVIFASPQELGPFWLQFFLVLLLVSFFRYWMHRLQHQVEFLWKLHAYHHGVTDIRASNLFVSHPIDFALRNVLVFLLLGMVGFNPLAVLIAIPAVQIYGALSHCGGDVKGGWLNYIFVTPEVHRWHHSVDVPEGHKYAVNYGVEYSFWDILFGTYYLPRENAQVLQPARMGHPGGLADESNYIRLLLAPLGLYPAALRLKRLLWMPADRKARGSLRDNPAAGGN